MISTPICLPGINITQTTEAGQFEDWLINSSFEIVTSPQIRAVILPLKKTGKQLGAIVTYGPITLRRADKFKSKSVT